MHASLLSTSRPEGPSGESDNNQAEDEITLRGLLNLFVLLLMTYNIRFVIENLRNRDLVMLDIVGQIDFSY